MRIKEYSEDFRALPNPVRYTIYMAVVILALFLAYQSISNYAGMIMIEKLEKENAALSKQIEQSEQTAAAAQSRAENAEVNSANEALRAKELERQLKILDKEIKKQDEKILKKSKDISTIDRRIDNLRRSQPKLISTDELEKRLCERYGNCQKIGN